MFKLFLSKTKNNRKWLLTFLVTSDVNPHCADPDPQNLINADLDPVRIQVNEITKLISTHLLKVERKKMFSNLYLNLRD